MTDLHNPAVVEVDPDYTYGCDSCDFVKRKSPIRFEDSAPPAATPPSVESPTFSVPEPDCEVSKHKRSYERARQRLKKPEDIHKAKMAKRYVFRCGCCGPERWEGNAGRSRRGHRSFQTSLAEAEGDPKVGFGDMFEQVDDVYTATLSPVARTVTLADLIKAPRKGSDKQFEMISRPRQVIVLDEFTETDVRHDLEDWEHVEAEEKRRKTTTDAPSYARVVASRA